MLRILRRTFGRCTRQGVRFPVIGSDSWFIVSLVLVVVSSDFLGYFPIFWATPLSYSLATSPLGLTFV